MNRLASRAPLLIDLADVPAEHCDDCLEGLFKALAVRPPGTDEGTIWRPHENPWLTAHVEDVTAWGQRALQAIQDAIAAAFSGAPIGELKKAAPWERLDTEERERTRARLEALTPAAWTIEDWMAYADLILADYLPDGVIRDMAEFAIVRGALSGKIAAALDAQARPVLPGAAAAIVANLPTARRFGMPPKMLTPVERAVLDISVERAAIAIAGLADDTRKAVKLTLVEGIRATVLGERDGGDEALRSRLLDTFGTLNRDWRRIAVTETGEAHTTGYVAAQPVGTMLRRVEAYVGACPFCRSINGRIMRVVAPDDPKRDGETDVWVGKTNAGRSASPKRRDGDALVERSPDQRWWVAAGLMHPHCFISPKVPIYTSQGWRPIGSIREGDMVLTHRGRFRAVNWVLRDARHTGRVLSFRITNTAGRNATWTAEMTPEHPLLLATGEWRAAGDIRAGDRITAMGRACETCSAPFASPRYPEARFCGPACVPQTGRNQFSTDDPVALEEARRVTSEANRRRLASMTVEERRRLTDAGRAAMAERGYAHLQAPQARMAGARQAAASNYRPSPTEEAIALHLRELGLDPSLQLRVEKAAPRPRARFWWLDIALPAQKIAVEIDGEPWHDRMNGGRDEVRDADLRASGWTVLRFPHGRARCAPAAVAEEVARLAMNHDSLYHFAGVQVMDVRERAVEGAKLYNFGVDQDESYVIGRGVVVHNCRGRWVMEKPAPIAQADEDGDFQAWLDAEAKRHGLP